MNLTGRLNLSFRVGNDGRPRGIRVSGSTGHGGLDRYARDTARSLGGLPTGCSRQITFSVRFDLRRSSRR
jgi:TonB family protein